MAVVLLLALFVSACQGTLSHPAEPTAISTPSSGSTPEREPSSTPTLPPPPIPTADATRTCLDAGGQVTSLEIESDLLPKPLRVSLYLPPCFRHPNATEYPLLILLHGQSYTETHWLDLGLKSALDRQIALGNLPPLLVALPYEEYSLQDPLQSYFEQALVEVLLPYLQENYSAATQRACRAIGGISRGAAWAVHIGFRDWQLFSVIGAHSLPPFPSDRYRAPYWVQNIPAEEMPALYMDIGDTDTYLAYATEFHQVLQEYSIEHEWHLNQGGHDDAYWRAHLEEYLRWYGDRLSTCP